ncbi:MAG TPA: hypothetical protein VKY85_14335 [Candidatus Angelobacter sp.]|nr:hypothetical protein [Candidatus Angelobacter sp.]
MVAGLVQQKISLEVGDGSKMDTYVARPDDKSVHNGIMVGAPGL